MVQEQSHRAANAVRQLRYPLFVLLLLAAAFGVAYLYTNPNRVAASGSAAIPPSCPVGLAGKFTTGWSWEQPAFQWYRFFGEHTFTASDTMGLSFAVVPFESGDTLVALDEIDGRTGYQLTFSDGLVNGVVPYNAGSWNTVKAEFDFGAKEYQITVNGVSSAPLPFDFGDANSVQALRVHSFGASAETFAWFDSISVVWSSASPPAYLFEATFSDGALYSASPGTIATLEPPASYAQPEVCTSAISLQVSPTVLEFSAVEGGSDPEPQFLFIGCSGLEPLSWEADESISWLSMSPIAATHPTTVVVSVNVDGLSPGVHTGEIIVSSDAAQIGSPQAVYVSLTIRPATVEPSTACPEGPAKQIPAQWYEYFGEYTFAPTDTLSISFSIVPTASGQTMIGMDEVGGRTGYALYFFDGIVYGASHGNNFQDDTPLATYDPGAWNTVQADYDFSTHQYTLTVNGIITSPIPFYFSDSSSVWAVRAHADSPGWLDSLSIVRQGDGAVLYASTFDDGTLPGDYTLPQTCTPVSGTLQVAPLALAFSAVEGGDAPPPQVISVTHSGPDPLSWTAGESLEWASLSSSSGTTPAAVEVHVDIEGLAPGTYGGPITFYAAGAQNGPQQVNVSLEIEPSSQVPIQLSAEPGVSSIRLDWNPTNDPEVTTYRVFRAVEGSGSFTVTAITSDTTYMDEDPALQVGTSYCYYVEALHSDGQVAATSNTDCATFGQVELWIPDVCAAPAQTRIVPVNIRNATGLQIAASDIWIDYDGTVIELLNVSRSTLTAGYAWTYTITSTGTYSQVRISYYDTSPAPPTLYGEGVLLRLKFHVLGSETEESPLNLVEFVAGVGGTTLYTVEDLYNPIPLHLQSGVFHVGNGCVLGDLNGNEVVEAVDAYLALKMATGEMVPTVAQLLAGDVNGNGEIDAADATLIHYYAANGHWPPLPPSTSGAHAQAGAPIVISLDDVSGAPGDTVQTVLRGENLSNWAGGEILVAYDTDVVDEIIQVEPTGLASGFALRYYDDGEGLLRIALASSTPQSGDGSLVTISLRVAPSAPGGKVPLLLADVALNDIAGRDFVTSALQHTVVRYHGTPETRFYTYLPVILK
jgi:hypothetical protein